MPEQRYLLADDKYFVPGSVLFLGSVDVDHISELVLTILTDWFISHVLSSTPSRCVSVMKNLQSNLFIKISNFKFKFEILINKCCVRLKILLVIFDKVDLLHTGNI
jgi:hypothetical protein